MEENCLASLYILMSDAGYVGKKHVLLSRKNPTPIDRHINEDSDRYRLHSLNLLNSYKLHPRHTIFDIF
jgi:hypothetical protein